jgi:hypothetical protein
VTTLSFQISGCPFQQQQKRSSKAAPARLNRNGRQLPSRRIARCTWAFQGITEGPAAAALGQQPPSQKPNPRPRLSQIRALYFLMFAEQIGVACLAVALEPRCDSQHGPADECKGQAHNEERGNEAYRVHSLVV